MSETNLCPFKMDDGRYFTDYRPRSSTNAELFEILSDNKMINSSTESRLYLQQNAEKIMKDNFEKANKNILYCTETENAKNYDSVLPNKYIIKCDSVSCKKTEFDKDGLGTTVSL